MSAQGNNIVMLFKTRTELARDRQDMVAGFSAGLDAIQLKTDLRCAEIKKQLDELKQRLNLRKVEDIAKAQLELTKLKCAHTAALLDLARELRDFVNKFYQADDDLRSLERRSVRYGARLGNVQRGGGQ